MAEARSTGSLPVPNVQALAETCNGTDGQVPERYLIVDAGSETEKVVADSASAIPIIDLRRLLDPRSSPEECAKLGSACHDWGFFQVSMHDGSTRLSMCLHALCMLPPASSPACIYN